MKTRFLISSLAVLVWSQTAWAASSLGAANGGRAAPAPAVSQSSSFTDSGAPSRTGLSVWGILPWGGYGAGARYLLPLDIRPLLSSPGVRDNFALEFGADFLRWSYDYGAAGLGFSYSWTEILPVVGVMWDIWLSPRFAFYPKIEGGYAYGWFSSWQSGPQPSYGGVFVDGAAGVLYSMDNGLTLRAEAGIAGLKLGVGWLF